MGYSVGCGIFIKGSVTKLSYTLPGHYKIIQAKFILKAIQYLMGGGIFSENVLIHSNEQAAVKLFSTFVLK